MKKKSKLFLWLMVFVLLFTTACFNNKSKDDDKKNDNKEEEKADITPLLYKVTKDGSDNVIYLFGSIHIADKLAYPFPDFIMNAYNDSEYLAVEVDVVEFAKNQKAQMALIQSMLYTDGTTIKDHISSETYDELVKYLKENSTYRESYDVYKPYFFMSLINESLIEKSGLKSDGIDEYLLKKAKKDDKKILEVESCEEQFDLLLGFSDKLYELMIEDFLNDIDGNIEETKKMYELWKKGDYDGIVSVVSAGDIDIDENYSQEEIDIINDYNKKLVDDRNVTMTEKLMEYFDDGKKVFFTVGEGHVVGEDGIVKRLEKEGYTVQLVK